MRFTATLAAGLVSATLGLWCMPAQAYDTIDCARDGNAAERTICSSQRLQILDAKVTEAYVDVMRDNRLSPRIKHAVHESQLDFLARRNDCGRDRDCLAWVMERRASHIAFYR